MYTPSKEGGDMALRDELLRRIEKKQEEIFSLESQLREAKSYLQALEDTVRILPREGVNEGMAEAVLRPGSTIAKARDAILAAGHPLHIQDLLSAVGKPATKETRAAVSGSLSFYVRRAEIFTRPAPNTFGLIELEAKTQTTTNGGRPIRQPVPPPGFGEEDEQEG
jgi:seryl-tRNA synthetase